MRKGNLTDKYTEYIASCIATTKPKAFAHTVQFKGNMTHADRAHAIYWLKARSLSTCIGMCEKENLPKLTLKRQ